MKYRPNWTLLGMGALIVMMLFTFPLWRRVFLGRSAVGPYPSASDAQRAVFASSWGSDLTGKAGQSKADRNLAATAYVSMLTVVPAPTAEQPTPDLPDAQIISTATFADLDAVRTAGGTATLYRSPDGSLLLRLDNFHVTNAPQLAVYLCGSDAPQVPADLDSNGVSRWPVGPLKGTQGNQQYKIAKEINFSRYKSVVIFSEALNIIYAFAPFQ